MNVRRAVETILALFLFLLRVVWSRHANVTCDGGRREGDKWFDGCRWCVCQDSGPLCSSSDCSPLVSLVPPCNKVNSRWWDGCYFCRCYSHGIECTASKTCAALRRSQQVYADFMSNSACTQSNDDQCICGIDGVRSCTAEVIDRNAYPAIRVRLYPVVPAPSTLVSPSVMHYDRPFRRYDAQGTRIQASDYNVDSSFIETPEYDTDFSDINYNNKNSRRNLFDQHKRHHSVAKRQTYQDRRHSFGRLNRKRQRSRMSRFDFNAKESGFASQNNNNYKNSLPGRNRLSNRKVFKRRKTFENQNIFYGRQLEDPIDKGPFYDGSWGDLTDFLNEELDERPTEEELKLRPWALGEEEKLRQVYTNKKLQDSYEIPWGQDVEVGLNDEPLDRRLASENTPSILVVSQNRCRLSVRWYAGSLRCFCGPDNSITCGDPSFVASRIDGFRLEGAPCEDGQRWENVDSCRVCECQIGGVALCQRSPSCSLPSLVKPAPIDSDGEFPFDQKEFEIGGKEQLSNGQTDEFTGPEEQKIVWNNSKTDTKHESVNKNNDEDEDNIDGVIDEEVNNSGTYFDESATTKTNVNNILEDVIGSFESTRNPSHDVILDKREQEGSAGEVKSTDSQTTDSEIEELKRTTEVSVPECKPKSRWLDGCKRCICEHGKKKCDLSRCPKPMPIPTEPADGFEDIGNKHATRPVQIPPKYAINFNRDRPVDIRPPFDTDNPCGRFSVGDKFWDECNFCECTTHGPKCTAKNCD